MTAFTLDGTGEAGVDYVEIAQTLQFNNGPADSQTSYLFVTVLGDLFVELDEVFYVLLTSPDGATIDPGSNSAAVTIENDDAAQVRLALDCSVFRGPIR